MSIEKDSRLTIGWRVETDDVPDYMERWDAEWEELDPLVDRAGETIGEELYREDLCDIENEMVGDMLVIGVPTAKHELSMDAFMRDMDMRALLAREVYEHVMREQPKDGPYMISWTKVW